MVYANIERNMSIGRSDIRFFRVREALVAIIDRFDATRARLGSQAFVSLPSDLLS